MIRMFGEAALFATPFVLYAIFLFLTRAQVFDAKSWPRPVLFWLTAAALTLLIGSFFVLAQWSGAPAGSDYVPAHMDDGKLVPGHFRK